MNTDNIQNKFLITKKINTVNILAIFCNVCTSNASSIQIESLLKYLPKNINLKYYTFMDNLNIDTFDDYKKQYSEIGKLDATKNVGNNEIQFIQSVVDLLSSAKINVIFGWSNPYVASTIAICLGKQYNVPVMLRLGDFYVSKYTKPRLKEYLNAKCIIVPNEIMRNKVVNYYGKKYEDKIKIISQHYEPYTDMTQQKKMDNFINILHTGNVYEERKIDKFIETLGKLDTQTKNNIKLTFIGGHDKLNHDIKLCNENNINADFSKTYQFKNWYFEDAIPFKLMRKYFNDFDILLHLEFVTENNHFLSFKLIDYLSYGKPVITVTQKNSPNYYLSQECGFAFGDIEDNEHLMNAIFSMINNPTKYIPNNNRLKYDINNLVKKWVDEFYLFLDNKTNNDICEFNNETNLLLI